MTRVAARRGLQSSKLRVEKGSRYAVKAAGSWSIQPTGQQLTAVGNKDGAGRLTASVLDDTTMGEPIDLTDGIFTATESGTLFFRCGDHWNEIGDNAGSIRVTIQKIPTPQFAPDSSR